jgi:hypothetical protein
MNDYIIDSDIDFYKELKKPLDDSFNDCCDNKCLITNEELEDNHVVLECNHKFNYMPIYLDIVKNKTKNSYNMFSMSENFITCPYCRNKQQKMLPYYENMEGVDKIIGVNCIKETAINLKNNIEYDGCVQILKYGFRKGKKCNARCANNIQVKMCMRHYKIYEKTLATSLTT